MPPPVHGAALVGNYIKESKLINSSFKTKYIRLGTTNNFEERKKTTIIKIFRFIKINFDSFFSTLFYNPNLVYITLSSKGMGFYKDAFIIVLVKILRKKCVLHFHNKGVSSRQNKRLDNLLYKLVFHNSEVILLSGHLYSDISNYVSRQNIHICPNGIPIQETINDSKKRNNNEAINILFISNLIISKGIWVLLEACKILKNKDVNFQCTFIGVESEVTREELEEQINLFELKKHVKYVGSKYGDEKKAYLSQTDIFVHPTFNDCFPLVLIEAMQYSLPIVSTWEGGIPDIVEDGKTGFLVKTKDSNELAEKIKILIEDDDLRIKMAKKAKEKYLKEFTINKFENRLLNILNNIVDDNKV